MLDKIATTYNQYIKLLTKLYSFFENNRQLSSLIFKNSNISKI